MPILTSKARAQSGVLSTTIPTEVARRMGVKSGDELFLVEDGSGGYHVSASNPERAAMLRAHAEVMDEYRDVFAALDAAGPPTSI
jgi:bifunctional DNA-binding transcriptional regulator/antitoxin component of YhaV-PrlF toxin-antitoxin module